VETERKTVEQIIELGKVGFSPDRRTLCSVAHRFAVQLNLRHKFNNEEELAQHDWLRPFMNRNSDLSVR
jgi:hypothetical protein